MKKHTYTHALLGALLFSTLTACGDDGGATDGSTGNATTTMPSTDPTTTTNPSTDPTTTTNPSTDPTTTTNPSTDPTTTTNPTTDPTTTTDPTATDGTTGEDPGFIFPDDPFDAYTQIDRHGAVEAGTAGIAAAGGLGFSPGQADMIKIRDAYNASNPEEDAAEMWLGEIAKSITFFHDALDDDIMGFKLTPATFAESVAQAGPVILPDTIKYDPTKPTAYPNGRKLEDPVVDITLAAVLLSLAKHPLDTFVKLPLNPPKNDVAFVAEWPYLAPPHPAK